MLIIGITGRAGAGKTSLANYLTDFLGIAKIVPIAQTIKEFALDMGWDGNKNEKGRRLLQLLGTECGRDCIGEDIWLRHWRKNIDAMISNYIIADDVRYINEAAYIKANYGHIILVEGREDASVNTLHRSELEQASIIPDTVIDNSTSLESLKNEAGEFIAQQGWQHA